MADRRNGKDRRAASRLLRADRRAEDRRKVETPWPRVSELRAQRMEDGEERLEPPAP